MKAQSDQSVAIGPKETRPVYFEEASGYVDTQVFNRNDLGPGTAITGPAIIEQVDTTTVVHPGQSILVDRFRNLIISVGE
jgi:N-methylhydantoinase A